MATITESELKTHEEKIVEARKFLQRHSIDTSKMDDMEVITIINKIRSAKEEAVQVLSRGSTLDAMHNLIDKFIPEGFVGEFKGSADSDVARSQALGWTVCFDERAKKNTPTGASDGMVRLGDQILMMQPIETHIGNNLAREERQRIIRKKRLAKNRARDETQGKKDMLPVFSLDELSSSAEE